MDYEFEQTMWRLAYAHMEDARRNFLRDNGHPMRVFIYHGYEFENLTVRADLDETMNEVQRHAILKEATAVAVVGPFQLLRGIGDTIEEARNDCGEDEDASFAVLAVMMKLVSGKTYCLVSEIITEGGRNRLEPLLEIEDAHLFGVPIRSWAA